MKKDRNCGGNMYPTYQMNGMMPVQGGMPMPYPMRTMVTLVGRVQFSI